MKPFWSSPVSRYNRWKGITLQCANFRRPTTTVSRLWRDILWKWLPLHFPRDRSRIITAVSVQYTNSATPLQRVFGQLTLGGWDKRQFSQEPRGVQEVREFKNIIQFISSSEASEGLLIGVFGFISHHTLLQVRCVRSASATFTVDFPLFLDTINFVPISHLRKGQSYTDMSTVQSPTYLLASNWTFRPGGRTALGNIIVDPFRPHRPLTKPAKVSPLFQNAYVTEWYPYSLPADYMADFWYSSSIGSFSALNV